MGADCIGYILVGPKHVDKRKIVQARKQLLKTRVKAQTMLDKEQFDVDVEKVFKCDMGAMGCDDPEDQLKYIVKVATDKFLDDFVSWWNSDGWRDSACRYYRPNIKIISATEMSWGDGPSENTSAELCQDAVQIGLTDLLGIE